MGLLPYLSSNPIALTAVRLPAKTHLPPCLPTSPTPPAKSKLSGLIAHGIGLVDLTYISVVESPEVRRGQSGESAGTKGAHGLHHGVDVGAGDRVARFPGSHVHGALDRKSTRLNSSH